MLWNDELDSKFEAIVTADHALSLGYVIKVVSNSPHASRKIRVSCKKMDFLLGKSKVSQGMHAVWDNRKLIVIAINYPGDHDWSKHRVIELITHEVSHAVDGFFERAHINRVDTELRAYYIDWIVGKTLYHFPAIAK